MASPATHLASAAPASLILAGVPIHDWQFWAVTVIAIAAGAFLLRPLWRKARGSGKQRRATLTIGGKPIGKEPAAPGSDSARTPGTDCH